MRERIARTLSLAATFLVATLWLIAAPAVSAGDPCYHGFTIPANTTETTTQVKLMPCAFAPTVTQVAVGSTVTFVNGPDFTHLVTGANQAWGSRDVEIRPGGTVSYTFDKAGVYPYACALHRGMSGTILVGDATAAGGGAATAVGATTTGTTTGTTTDTGTTASEAAPGVGAPDQPGILALAVAIGVFIGAAAVVAASRLRRAGVERASQQTA